MDLKVFAMLWPLLWNQAICLNLSDSSIHHRGLVLGPHLELLKGHCWHFIPWLYYLPVPDGHWHSYLITRQLVLYRIFCRAPAVRSVSQVLLPWEGRARRYLLCGVSCPHALYEGLDLK